jgi:hypothetical protein
MPIILETGAGLANANSYASVAEADAYFATHPFYADNWDDLGEPEKEHLLIAASAQLDSLITWRGYIYSSTQALGWPRSAVVDDEGRLVHNASVPSRVKQAVFELAFHLSRGDPYAVSSSAGIDRLKIDVIELEFSGSTKITAVPAAALTALRGLGDYAFGSRVKKVLVG